jgi:hypothetical protein
MKLGEETGFVYDRGIPPTVCEQFFSCLTRENVTWESVAGPCSGMPWKAVDMGVKTTVLKRIHEEIVLRSEEHDIEWSLPVNSRGLAPQQFKEKIKRLKQQERSITFVVYLGDACRGIPRKYAGLMLARAFMQAAPELVHSFRAYGVSHWETNSCMPEWIVGDDYVTLVWHESCVETLCRKCEQATFVQLVNQHYAPWGTLYGVADETAGIGGMQIESSFPFCGERYCVAHGLTYTLHKKDGGMAFLFSKNAIKKKIILSLQAHHDNVWRVDVTIASKCDPVIFAQEAFDYPDPYSWIRTRMCARK